ncbi:hypothetical protein [Nocardioides psychrotolerans]|uniref:hypothetical protein n=1 Tax=Nocardioides psychrotolerans TaxID=1005945 RepID=UPI0031377574
MKRQSHHTHTRSHTRARAYVLPLAAAALVGAMLPITSGSAVASPAPSSAEEGEPAFSGFSGEAVGTPVEIEIYEPSIPIPSTPQAEFLFGYSRVEADSSSSAGRASYLWPGDSLGEGAKTVFENLGLPPEISGPIAAQGYPFQVNSNFPSGEDFASDEPFPGVVQRTGAADGKVYADMAYSSDCQAQDPDDGGGDDGGGGGAPGLPGLPELPGLPGLAGITGGLTSALTGGSGASAQTSGQGGSAAAAEEETPCQFPAELAALVDVGGYTSTSSIVDDPTQVRSVNRAVLSDISLLGGVVQISSIQARSVSTSNGKTSDADGGASYGVITVAGQKFRFGPDGFEAAGQSQGAPETPAEVAAALEELGLTITLPKPETEAKGGKATSKVVGMSVEVDLKTLNLVLTQLPLSDIFIELPDDLGPIKSALLSAANLASRVVVNLGVAESGVETVQGIDIPVPPTPEPEEETDEGEGDGASGGNTSGGATGSSAGVPPSSTPAAPGSDVAPTAGPLPVDAALTSGLPKLFSIPGVLLFGGLALATVLGSYMRKMGALALGGGAACPHGLDSGLPDLRKA